MKSFVLLAAFGLTAFAATAQRVNQDYLVTAGGDTLRGRLQIPEKLKTVRLYQEGKGTTEFAPAEVTSYGDADGPIGVSKAVGPHGNRQFVAPLVHGFVSLYTGKNTDGDLRYYLQPADTAYVIEVAPGTARLTYLKVLTGCPTLDFTYSKIESRYPYTTPGVTSLITTYNTCRQPQQPSQVVKAPNGIRTSYGIKAGLNASDFKFSQKPYTGQHQKALGYQVGLFVQTTNKSRLSALVEITYLALRSSYGPIDYFNGYAAYTTTLTTSVRYSQLQIPLLLRYTFGRKSIHPYLNAGPSYGLNFNNQSANIFQSSNQTEPDKHALHNPGGASFGLAGGAGILVQRASLPTLSLEVRTDQMLDATGFYESAPTHKSLRLDLGIIF
ncbi:porin family protein [Hymenobacter jejuensis]|uniref:porin family protein n=1 Tax=Hymenobacter jejuensis TaxID=2502781 RepID=UPI0013FD0923|nr:porin family protein [Hymenobacter jejuensis]